MENKRTTLRSQTVQCPHCGEYYSVTYSHCPFCSEGRREAEEEKNNSFLGSLFGGKKAGKNREKQGEPAERSEYEETKAQKKSRKTAGTRDTHRSGSRKKISEMTPEERAAFDEDRRLRAEQRKRERERKSREEGRITDSRTIDIEGPTEVEGKTSWESSQTPGGMEQEFILIQPKQEAAPAVESVPVEVPPEVSAEVPVEVPAESSAPDAENPVQEAPAAVETVPESPVAEPSQKETAVTVESAVEPSPASVEKVEKIESDEDLDDLLNEIRQMISRSPVPELNQEQIAAKVSAVPVEELVDALIPQSQESESAPEAEPSVSEPELEVPEQTPAPEPPVQAEPVPTQEPVSEPASEEPEPVPAVEKTEAPEESPAETQEAQPVPGDAEQEKAEQTEAETVVPIPGGPLPFGEVKEGETSGSAAPNDKTVSAARDDWKEQGKKEPKKETKKGKPPVLLILSVLIIVAAVIILVKCIGPAFHTGILSGGQTASVEVQAVEGGAQTVTLDRTEVSMTEKGVSVTLIPAFAPEGTTGMLTWASSDPAIATVNAVGLVTSVAPGAVTITATMDNGQMASCAVTCDWQVEQGPYLAASAVTLDGQGKSVQVQVVGEAGAPVWASNDPSVATVTADGTVTAVNKGTADITCMVDGKTLTCKVDCIW